MITVKVENLVNLWSPEGILSVTLISSAFVMSIFFGIKLRWFRYRMKFPSVEEEATTSPVLLRTNSMTDVRQSCSTGRYSYFEDNSTAVSITNYSPITSPPTTSTISSPPPTSSSNVKSKKSKWRYRTFYTFFLVAWMSVNVFPQLLYTLGCGLFCCWNNKEHTKEV